MEQSKVFEFKFGKRTYGVSCDLEQANENLMRRCLARNILIDLITGKDPLQFDVMGEETAQILAKIAQTKTTGFLKGDIIFGRLVELIAKNIEV